MVLHRGLVLGFNTEPEKSLECYISKCKQPSVSRTPGSHHGWFASVSDITTVKSRVSGLGSRSGLLGVPRDLGVDVANLAIAMCT